MLVDEVVKQLRLTMDNGVCLKEGYGRLTMRRLLLVQEDPLDRMVSIEVHKHEVIQIDPYIEKVICIVVMACVGFGGHFV